MIAVDWGTTSLRAWRLGSGGAALDETIRPGGGILSVPPGGFPAALSSLLAPWLSAGESLVLLCGMVGSRQGWVEAPYLPCPAGAFEIVAALTPLPFGGAHALLVPGLLARDASGVPEVMRGEETQLLGLAAEVGPGEALACLPGSHSKWARLSGGRVLGFETHLTGEAYAALSGHTILARSLEPEAPLDGAAFDRGLARAGQPGGLLHHLFGLRAWHLIEGMTPAEAASCLSGLLIGHEVREAGGKGPVHLVGGGFLVERYARALGARAVPHRGEALAAAGLHALARAAGLLGEDGA